MNKGGFFILALIACGMGMILRAFFGGGSENKPIQNDKSGVINQLIDTGNIQTNSGDENIGISTQTGNQLPDEILEIRVVMPRYFYNSGRKKFAQDLYTQQKIYINFNFIDNLNIYRTLLYNDSFNQADLILLPYDRIENIQVRTFTFQQNLDTVFDPLISPIILDNNIKFLPFAADPVVMYTLKGYHYPANFSEIFELVSNRTSKNPLYFPIFFGITSEDYDNKGFLREYQDIIRYSLMHYFITCRDSNSLGKWIDSNVFENYNINNLNTILSAISNSACEDFPSICFQLYDFVAIRFGFLSDTDVVRQYFSNRKSNFDNTSKEPILFYTLESPVRIRGRSIPASLQDIKTINGVYTLLVYYMNNHDKYNLRNSTLPVFAGNTRLFDNVFVGLRGYILQSGGNFINNAKNQKIFWQLIEYQISAKDYLKKNGNSIKSL